MVTQIKKYDIMEQTIENYRIHKAVVEAINGKLDHLIRMFNENRESKMGKHKIGSIFEHFRNDMININPSFDKT